MSIQEFIDSLLVETATFEENRKVRHELYLHAVGHMTTTGGVAADI